MILSLRLACAAHKTIFRFVLAVLFTLVVANQAPAQWKESRTNKPTQNRYGPATAQPTQPNQLKPNSFAPVEANKITANRRETTTPISSPPASNQSGNTSPIKNNRPLSQVRPNGPLRARVTKGSGSLPNDHGQVWREYDIRPYTMRNEKTQRPEQVIVDWVLRETGYEAWHSEPVGLLSANRRTLRVYHTPAMQATVADIVDRFVNGQSAANAFGMHIVTVTNPNWRAKALSRMQPIPVQTPGIQGWLLAKEDAALLLADLRRRNDVREHTSTQMLVANGESTLLSTMRPRTYLKGIIPSPNKWPGYQPEMGQIEEGFSLEFSPLLSLDQRTADAVVKLRLNQIEKMVPVQLDVPSAVSANQRTQIEVPQMTMANLHERFRWPTDKVLVLSMGVVATPAPVSQNMLVKALSFNAGPPRADALMFIESKGRIAGPAQAQSGAAVSTANRLQQQFHGRY